MTNLIISCPDFVLLPLFLKPWVSLPGLYDKNGKKIFEGDIVKALRICNQEVWTGYVVMWKGCFAIKDAKTRNVPAIDLFNVYEVIGNIHDNPELLEEGA